MLSEEEREEDRKYRRGTIYWWIGFTLLMALWGMIIYSLFVGVWGAVH